jgi:hypothetical protein
MIVEKLIALGDCSEGDFYQIEKPGFFILAVIERRQ